MIFPAFPKPPVMTPIGPPSSGRPRVTFSPGAQHAAQRAPDSSSALGSRRGRCPPTGEEADVGLLLEEIADDHILLVLQPVDHADSLLGLVDLQHPTLPGSMRPVPGLSDRSLWDLWRGWHRLLSFFRLGSAQSILPWKATRQSEVCTSKSSRDAMI